MRYGLKLIFLVWFLGFIQPNLSGQDKYWVHTRDTATLSLSYPLINPEWCADWLPYCTYRLSKADYLLSSSEIRLEPVTQFAPLQYDEKIKYGFALEQIEANLLIEQGYTGKNVKIGIIDGGFLNADSHPSLARHFEQDRVKYYKDYITPDMPRYQGSKNLDDIHGTEVWALVGGKHESTQVIGGIAMDATYYLARTDHGAFEKRLEEDLLIQALEDFHQMGIRLVNVSLGYSDGYTRKNENYTPEQMDGKTTLLAQAIDLAYKEKEMLVVVSAGNEGHRPKWRFLSTPADAEGALSVGASILNGLSRMKYSSIGTPGLNYIKPEVVCFASNGTSFSAPIITGLAAAIMQMDSTLTVSEVKNMIISSASLFPYGNNYMGYGIPKSSRLLQLMNGEKLQPYPEVLNESSNQIKIKVSKAGQNVNILHKNQMNEVIEQNYAIKKKRKIKIGKPEDGKQTTVLLEDHVYEIKWKD